MDIGVMVQQKNTFLDQSQRRIYPSSSNHGNSPNDSVNYSLKHWLTPPI